MSRPVKVFKMYPMQVAIFQGDKGYSCVANKNQKNKATNAYEQSSMFFPSELPTMASLMTMAFEWIASNEVEKVQGGYQAQPAQGKYQPAQDDATDFDPSKFKGDDEVAF